MADRSLRARLRTGVRSGPSVGSVTVDQGDGSSPTVSRLLSAQGQGQGMLM
ncbi:hypothetical protein [Streptomyces sp. NPDC050856]|uniref:hypothetical protein n=1 Tax=Streptomyces sp. NPDC050856 TaxID=3154939 RepID=UPI0033F63929